MKIARTVAELREAGSGFERRLAFVPTMGALHAGHLSLVDEAKRRESPVLVSIYVNPTQFGDGEDFETYPRDVGADLSVLELAGVDVVFLPGTKDIYPDGPGIRVRAGDAANGLESETRPFFFDGVVTVVHRFFTIVEPRMAIFGEKDFQQLQVIREMVARYRMGIQVIGAPIQRDAHGLALSSRNVYLKPEELVIARRLNHILYSVADRLAAARTSSADQNLSETQSLPPGAASCSGDIDRICEEASEMLATAGFDVVDYVRFVAEWNRLLVAVRIGGTRLIDNCTVPA